MNPALDGQDPASARIVTADLAELGTMRYHLAARAAAERHGATHELADLRYCAWAHAHPRDAPAVLGDDCIHAGSLLRGRDG